MPLSELFQKIAFEEGFRPDIYLDTKGKPTVGHGLRVDDPATKQFLHPDVVSGKRPITPEESGLALQSRIDLAVQDAMSFMGGEDNFVNKLSNSQQKAVIDMSFNLGLTKLNKFKNLRKELFLGNALGAKREVLDSKYAREDVPNRALRNANLMLE